MNKKSGTRIIATGNVLTVFMLLFAWNNQTHASLPGYILNRIAGVIEGAFVNELKGFVTRDGESIASAGSVWMDYGTAVEAYWYADEFGNYHQTIQQNHLQGEEHINGGFELLDRNFSYHDWEVWDAEGLGTLEDPLQLENHERIAGTGFVVIVNNENTWIGSGTVKHWDASYVINSDYSNTGGELLRRPGGDFNIKIEYRLADLDYSKNHGLVSSERDDYGWHVERVSKVQPDKVSNIDLLPYGTEMVEGPVAYGKCKRVYKRILPNYSAKEWAGMIFLDQERFFDVVLNETKWGFYEHQIDYGWE